MQGSVGAAIGGSCAHPLDLIKAGEGTQKLETQSTQLTVQVRMQLQTEVPKLSMLQRLGKIWPLGSDGSFGSYRTQTSQRQDGPSHCQE